MKIKTLFLLIFSAINSFSQDINIDIQKSKLYKDEMIRTSLLFSENDGDDGLIVVRNTETVFTKTPYPKEYYIEHYDKNLNLVKKITLVNEKTSIIKGVIVKDNTINFIQFEYNKKERVVFVNILHSNIEELEFKKRELYKFDEGSFEKYFGNLTSSFLKNEFRFIDKNAFGDLDFSKKKEYFTIRFTIDKKEDKLYYFLVFDNNFKKIYETKFEKNNKYLDFKNIRISDFDGTIFLLSKVFENKSKKTKKKGKTNYHYKLFKLTEKEIKSVSLKEIDKFISSLYILSDKENVILVGFYSKKNDNYFSGVCRYNINSSDLFVRNKYFNGLTEQFFKDKFANGVNKKTKNIGNLEFEDVIIDKQGNIIINAEEIGVEDPKLSINNNINQNNKLINNHLDNNKKPINYFGDILSIKIDNEGEVLWSRNINKKQIGISNSSFTYTYINGKAYFFINATLKELKNNRFGFLHTTLKKSNLYVISISENDLSYKKLIDSKNSDAWYSVKNGIISKDFKSVIFQGSKKRNRQIIQLTIQ